MAALLVVLAVVAGGTGYLLGHGGRGASHTAPLRTANISSSAAGGSLNVAAVAAKVDPSVVDILTKGGISGTPSAFQAAGTGMIVTPSGEVVTNNHVVAQATSISVRLSGQSRLHPAKVVGVDPSDDVAVVQIEGVGGLPTVTFGNSSQLKVGTPVVAIGNALNLGGSPTVTDGIVSALSRSITAADSFLPHGSEHLTGLLQTDAPINPGNSGGPLVDASGQVIGMNTAVLAGSSSQPASGIGFAIPSDRIVRLADLIRSGAGGKGITIGPPAFLGVEAFTVNSAVAAQLRLPASTGAGIEAVVPGSPAAGAGIRHGDVIIRVNGSKVTGATSLRSLLTAHHPGSRVRISWVNSAGHVQSASVTLAAGPSA